MLVLIFLTMLAIVLSICIGFYVLITKVLKEKNPNKCYVFPYYSGNLGKPKKGKRIVKADGGIGYIYGKHLLAVPSSYPEIWHKNRITFYVDFNGDLITEFDKKFKQTTSSKDDLLYDLVTSDLITQAIKAFKGKNDAMLMIIALVVFLVGGILGFAVGKMTTQPKVITQSVVIPATTSNLTAPYIQK